jgi:hypothetical protein
MNNIGDILNNAPAGAGGSGGSPLSREEYAAKKKEAREALYALSDAAAMDVADDGGKFQQYLDLQGRLGYSAVNTLLILAQKPESTRLGDFSHWKDMGGSVRRDPTGISILEPQEYRKKDGTPGTGYNIKKVFDVSQVDTRKVKQTPPPSYDNRQLLLALIHKTPMKIIGAEELPGGLCAMTDLFTGEITVRKGMTFPDAFRSVAQELAYAYIRSDGMDAADPHFSAYCASYILCAQYGVDTKDFHFDEAPDYFAMMEHTDPQAVKHELSLIRAAAGDVAGRMAKQLDTQRTPMTQGAPQTQGVR